MQMYGMSGERLGAIGQEPEGLLGKLPAWKQDFLAKPSVSIRRAIAWVSSTGGITGANYDPISA